MSDKAIHPVPARFAQNALINDVRYHAMYADSLNNPDAFWGKQAEAFLSWEQPWRIVRQGDFTTLDIQWFVGGKLNACYNCLDRHLASRASQTAIIWEGNEPDESKQITYQALYEQTCQFANVLKNLGINKGDRVCIYLPMIPEAIITMLACARIGAIHSIVFAGFSPDSLKTRILDADCHLLITADEGYRGDKRTPLKQNADKALNLCPNVKHQVVVKRTGNDINWQPGRDIWYHEAMQTAETTCPIEWLDANDPLFILYTSGSTGKPKGVLHATGGYLVYAAMTHRYVFDYHEGDIHWCTADVGWITGHSYVVYGPLANGATTLVFEGVPTYPNFSRFWDIVAKHQVTIFYTAPTAIRALRREGDSWVKKANRDSLRLLGTVGEPINPDVWEWYFDVVGKQHCPIVDTWWQTETGGILLTPLPGATPMAPGSAAWPFFGIVPAVVNELGEKAAPGESGRLVIKQPWPGMMQTIYGDHQRFVDTYFTEVPHCYLTGDRAFEDEQGYFWITGRNDDVIKVSGHRLGTEEIESALLSHHAVSEAAVVGVPDEITGESIYAFVTVKSDITPTDELKHALIKQVRHEIGPIATINAIQWAPSLPKTRSGKIMRRILRKIAANRAGEIGDTSTLADASVVDALIASRSMMQEAKLV